MRTNSFVIVDLKKRVGTCNKPNEALRNKTNTMIYYTLFFGANHSFYIYIKKNDGITNIIRDPFFFYNCT